MTDETDFLRELRTNPADRSLRLVYADFLDERGEARAAALQRVLAEPASDERRLAFADACERAGDPARAEFVRVQVELSQLGLPRRIDLGDTSVSAAALYRSAEFQTDRSDVKDFLSARFARAADLIDRERRLWDAGMWRDLALPIDDDAHTGCPYLPVTSRGFVAVVNCSAADWIEHGDDIREEHPVERLRLVTMPAAGSDITALGIAACGFVAAYRVAGQVVGVNERELVERRRGRDVVEWERWLIGRLFELRWPGLAVELPAQWVEAPVEYPMDGVEPGFGRFDVLDRMYAAWLQRESLTGYVRGEPLARPHHDHDIHQIDHRCGESDDMFFSRSALDRTTGPTIWIVACERVRNLWERPARLGGPAEVVFYAGRCDACRRVFVTEPDVRPVAGVG